jgi:hypothetical protein
VGVEKLFSQKSQKLICVRMTYERGVEASSFVLHKMKAPKWVYIAPMVVSGSLHASGAIPNMTNGQ